MSAGEVALDVIEHLLESLVHRLTGKREEELPDIKSAVASFARETFEDLEKGLEVKARRIIDAFGLTLAIRDVADQAAETPKAFEPPAGGGMVGRALEGIPITVLAPGEEFETKTVVPIDDLFDASSNGDSVGLDPKGGRK